MRAIEIASFWYSFAYIAKRFSSLSCIAKPRTSLEPFKFSLVTTLKSSSLFWTLVYFTELVLIITYKIIEIRTIKARKIKPTL